MLLRYAPGSWNPNKYHRLHELSLLRVCVLVGVVALLAVLSFLVLLLPALLHIDEAVEQLHTTTDITLSGSFTQTAPTYLMRNPDILVTTQPGDAFITITPEHIAVKRFVYFDTQTYEWEQLNSLDTLPATHILTSLAFFTLPSFLLWGTMLMLGGVFTLVLLYTLFTYFVLHTRNLRILYADLCKVALYAALPSMMLFGVIPILRLGLPLAIILGFQFVLWLVLALLGTALFAEQHTPRR
jgi:hypothetical protein